jgi:hypothetical protein
MKKVIRSKSQLVQPGKILIGEQEKSEEIKNDSCGPGCRFFIAISNIISRVVKIENE